MSSPEAQLADHALVSLNVLTDEPSFPKRTVCLSRSDKILRIGRASKALSKGINAGPDNGYFQSPVMSREHAEIEVDLEHKTINITDKGSLHGTLVNGEPLTTNIPCPIHDGTEVQFGIPVHRGPETFPPTSVKVGFQFFDEASELHNRVFCVPLDAYDDDDVSDGESVQVIEAVKVKPANDVHVGVTDLTADDSEDESVVEALARPPEPGDGKASRSAKGEGYDILGQPSQAAPSSPTPRYESVYSPHMDSPRFAPSSPSDMSDVIPDIVIRREESLQLSDEDDEDILSDGEDDESVSPRVSIDSDSDSDSDDHHFESEIDALDSDACESEISDGEFGEDEPLRDEPHDRRWDSASDSEQEVEYTEFNSEEILTTGPEPGLLSVPPTASTPTASTTVQPSDTAKTRCDISTLLNPARQPSPSDLALAGPAPPTSGLVPAQGVSTADVLGPKTGKQEFWEARHANKLAMARGEATPHFSPPNPSATICAIPRNFSFGSAGADHGYDSVPGLAGEFHSDPITTSTATFEMPLDDQKVPVDSREVSAIPASLSAPKAPVSAEPAHRAVSSSAVAQKPVVPKAKYIPAETALLASGDRFLNTHPQEDSADKDLTPTALAGDDDVISAAVLEARKKRKADEISESDDRGDASTTAQAPASQVEPPAKRQATIAAKKSSEKGTAWALAEKVGFAALGGVMVLGSLIYTAPSFA